MTTPERTLSTPGSWLVEVSFRVYWLRNDETGDVYPLGPMYGGTVAYAQRKLERENLPYRWTLLAPMPKEPTS